MQRSTSKRDAKAHNSIALIKLESGRLHGALVVSNQIQRQNHAPPFTLEISGITSLADTEPVNKKEKVSAAKAPSKSSSPEETEK